jgi:hypothetical protein
MAGSSFSHNRQQHRRRPAASKSLSRTTSSVPVVLMRVEQQDGEPVEIKYSTHRAACSAFTEAMSSGVIEQAELWTLTDQGEPGTRFARYANDGV